MKNLENFENNIPIYIQIIESIKNKLIKGEIAPGEKIMSVRDYAVEFKVNPNTVQKALCELEKDGLVETESTNGRFATKNTEIIKELKNKSITRIVDDFVKSMNGLGVDGDMILDLIMKKVGERK